MIKEVLQKNGSCKRVKVSNVWLKFMGVLIKERRIKKYEIETQIQKYDLISSNDSIIYNSNNWLYKDNV